MSNLDTAFLSNGDEVAQHWGLCVTAGFTTAQQLAVEAGGGPLAIIAGPGCGKTTVLAARIAHLVRTRGADPSSVLAVTFTAEAARRLRLEVGRQLDRPATDVAIHTLHAFGRKVIDTWPAKFGLARVPTVLQRDEALVLLRRAAEDLGWQLDGISMPELAGEVDRCRLADGGQQHDPLGQLADAYDEQLRRRGAIDFPTMLSWPLALLRADTQLRQVLQSAYSWILVDETQDLTIGQLALVELLAAEHRNLTVAGDPLQSIYEWLGAAPDFLRDFATRYAAGKSITLTQNHRATGSLVELANALGALLAQPTPLTTDNPPGPPARVVMAEQVEDEAHLVAHHLGGLLERGLLDQPGDAAVLYRTRAQADILAAALRRAGVPYRMHADADLFGERVVRDVLAYLRLARDPAESGALARIADRPRRGLGRLQATLIAEPTTLSDLLSVAAQFEPSVMAAAAQLLAEIYQLHAYASRGTTVGAVLDQVLEVTGYGAWLDRHPDRDGQLRIVGRLRTVALHADVGLGDWLDALAMGEDVGGSGPDSAARLCSIHQSKGKEWRAVFLAGAEEGLLPHHHAQDAAGLDAELRLLYVALTRVRERLFISYCQRRARGGASEARQPSRWLYALPPELLAV